MRLIPRAITLSFLIHNAVEDEKIDYLVRLAIMLIPRAKTLSFLIHSAVEDKEIDYLVDVGDDVDTKGNNSSFICHLQSSVEDKEIEDLVKAVDDADTKGNNSDWEPPVPKRKRETPKVVPVSSRYADLPKRESRYRIAKNLDAVTRKAKQVYESSEMFIEQKVKRRKSVSWLK